MSKQINGAVIGYGGAFNMGKYHFQWMQGAGITPYAACDIDPARVASAAEDFPGVHTFTDYREMLKDPALGFVVCILPHNLHAQVCLDVVNAGKSCMSEKPFTLTVAEADEIIAAAHARGVTLTVFHNRRFDGDILAVEQVIKSGDIGEVFHIEIGAGGYGKPGTWWRSDKAISGGGLYDWGVHYIDWVLKLLPDPIENVTGFFHKRVWDEVTNEDHTQAIIRFKTGKYADVQVSSIAAVNRPHLRILGTRGGILYQKSSDGKFTVRRYDDGTMWDREVDYSGMQFSNAGAAYYQNLGEHMRNGTPLAVTAESARRNIAVIEAAEKSSKTHQAEPVPYED